MKIKMGLFLFVSYFLQSFVLANESEEKNCGKEFSNVVSIFSKKKEPPSSEPQNIVSKATIAEVQKVYLSLNSPISFGIIASIKNDINTILQENLKFMNPNVIAILEQSIIQIHKANASEEEILKAKIVVYHLIPYQRIQFLLRSDLDPVWQRLKDKKMDLSNLSDENIKVLAAVYPIVEAHYAMYTLHADMNSTFINTMQNLNGRADTNLALRLISMIEKIQHSVIQHSGEGHLSQYAKNLNSWYQIADNKHNSLSYQLLIAMIYLDEKSFSQELIQVYEEQSKKILNSKEAYISKKNKINTLLDLALSLYKYKPELQLTKSLESSEVGIRNSVLQTIVAYMKDKSILDYNLLKNLTFVFSLSKQQLVEFNAYWEEQLKSKFNPAEIADVKFQRNLHQIVLNFSRRI